MSTVTKPVIAVVYYSTYGHIATLAEEVIKGVEASGAIAKPYVIQETLPEAVLSLMHAGSSLTPKYPILTPNDLKDVDGIVLGAPTRFGSVPAQVSAFFDQCGQLWATGALVGKFVTMFTSTAGQHSGQESTVLTTFPFFAHHGLAYVPIGYANPAVGSIAEVSGGTPYGASTISAADGSRQPLKLELEIAEFQGKYFADFVGTFLKGKSAAATAPVSSTTATTASQDPVVEKDVKEETAAVPATGAVAAGTAGATGATVDPAQSSAATTAAEPTTEKSTDSAAAATTEKPTETAAPATTTTDKAAGTKAAEAPKKKKGGFFGCCGGSNID